MLTRVGAAAVVALLLSGACAPRGGPVTRLVEGRYDHGRYVTVRAYEAYARGAHLEARGDLDAAMAAYGTAAVEDPDSPEIWSRVGALRCRRRSGDAEAAFASAERADPTYAPLWYERAECLASRGQTARALESARRSFRLDPDRVETTWLLADLLEKTGQPDHASRILEAEAARDPSGRGTWEALAKLAERTRNAPLFARAARAMARHDHAPRGRPQALDAALVAGELTEARRLALRSRHRAADVAVRAAALGASDSAREQGALVLAANPDSADALIAVLVAADLSGQREHFSRGLSDLGDDPEPASPLAALLFGELLLRHVGAEAARTWLVHAHLPERAHVQPPSSVDPLYQRVRERLGARGVLPGSARSPVVTAPSDAGAQ